MEIRELPIGDGAVPVIASEVMARSFTHGFTLRAGGVSPEPFDSLNLGWRWGDDPARVTENRRRWLRAAGVSALHLAVQVHGARVHRVRQGDGPRDTARQEADALISDRQDMALAVLVADCAPILLADERTGAYAAVHAGWRGTVAGVLAATVEALGRELGSRPRELRAAIGPAIGACCFEVGPEVADLFHAALPEAKDVVLERAEGRPHVDLARAQRRLLEWAGLDPAAIEDAAACTRCDPQGRFFSYRRSGPHTGQHAGFIGRRG